MIFPVLIAALFVASFTAFFYALDLFLFYQKENRSYEKKKCDPAYPKALRTKMKKKVHPQKKNYLLFLYASALLSCGQSERAEALFSFVRPDPILGIKKREAK